MLVYELSEPQSVTPRLDQPLKLNLEPLYMKLRIGLQFFQWQPWWFILRQTFSAERKFWPVLGSKSSFILVAWFLHVIKFCGFCYFSNKLRWVVQPKVLTHLTKNLLWVLKNWIDIYVKSKVVYMRESNSSQTNQSIWTQPVSASYCYTFLIIFWVVFSLPRSGKFH